MRVFIAIPLPQTVRDKLAKLQQPISGVRWQNAAQYHLTLKFLGSISKEEVKLLQDKLVEIAMPSFAISLKGLGLFPDRQQPSVVWAGVKKNNLLTDLQENIESCCLSLGYNAEKRPFKPHITLARIHKGAGQEVLTLADQHKQFQISGVRVEEFVLYASTLKPGGATHHRLQTFSLEKKAE